MNLATGMTHSIVTGAVFMFAWFLIPWEIMFISDVSLLSPITVDRSPAWHQPPSIIHHYPLLNNLLLLLLFTVPHSVILRGPVKAVVDCVIPEQYFKTFYIFQSCVLLIIVAYMWQPIPTVVWSISSPALVYALQGLAFFNWFLFLVAEITLNPFDLFGFTAPLHWLREKSKSKPPSEPKLIVTGIFGVVRHPVYTTIIMGVWITPTMTVGHALLAFVFTLYTVIAVKYFEEPELVRQFGQDYIEYTKRVPGYFPSLNWRKASAKKE